MTQQELKCEDRINESWENIRSHLLELREKIEGNYKPELTDEQQEEAQEEFSYYGLCFDYVELDENGKTYDNNNTGYWRYQISTGGPSEEIQYFDNGKIEFVFKDWFDHAEKDITGDDIAEWILVEHGKEIKIVDREY